MGCGCCAALVGLGAAEQRDHGGAELCAAMARADGVVAVQWWRWCGDVRAQRGAGRQLKEAARILGMRATDGKVGEDCGRDGCNAEEADRKQWFGVIRLRW